MGETRVDKAIKPEGTGSIREMAEELLGDKDFSELFEIGGAVEIDETASAALRALLVEKAAEYATEAVRFSKRRGSGKVGAAAVLISTQKERW